MQYALTIPKVLNNTILNDLVGLKNCVLLTRNHLVIIREFTIEDSVIVKPKTWYRSERKITRKILTAIKVHAWNDRGLFWGILEPDEAINWLLLYDLQARRQEYINTIREPLKALGINFNINKQ